MTFFVSTIQTFVFVTFYLFNRMRNERNEAKNIAHNQLVLDIFLYDNTLSNIKNLYIRDKRDPREEHFKGTGDKIMSYGGKRGKQNVHLPG